MDNTFEIGRGRSNKLEQLKELSKLGDPHKILALLCLFVFLNAVKLTVVNYMLMPSKNVETFLYKLIYTLLVNLVFFSLFFKIKNKWPFFVLYAAQTVYLFANLSYFSYFGGYLHLFQASALLTEGVGPIKHFTIPVNFKMLAILIDMPFFLKLFFNYDKLASLLDILKQISKKQMLAFMILPCIMLLSIEGLNIHMGCSLYQLNKNFFISESKIIERYGTLINNISDLTVNFGGENLIKHFQYGKTVSAISKSKKKPNIVAIQVESMDSNIINQEYNSSYIMPYLHSLSQSNVYYKYSLSYHKSGGTSDSEFSILNSIEPLSTYPSIKIPKYDYPNSFVKQLTGQSYYAMAFHGNIGNYYNRDVAFPKMGFNEFYDIKKMGFEESGWGAPDNEVFNFAFNKMKEQKAPFFTYVITMSSHMPFNFTADYYTNSSYDGIADETVRNYFTSMSYVDKSIEEFVGKIKSEFPGTYILIWGDHTPGITSEDYKQASFTENNNYFEFVPLLILTPDNKKYEETLNAGSFLDIAPTILNAAGINFTIESNGVNLLDPPAVMPRIPFKENNYDRAALYKAICEEQIQQTDEQGSNN